MKEKKEAEGNAMDAEYRKESPAEKQQNMAQVLKQAEEKTLLLFEQTLEAVNNLARIRLKCKLSNSRVSGVYRELKELFKVISVYK